MIHCHSLPNLNSPHAVTVPPVTFPPGEVDYATTHRRNYANS